MKGLNLAEWAIRHKQIVYFFIIAIITGGLWSYFHLGRSEDPDFTIRQAVVMAAWPGASAQQITQQVTDPLEKKLQDTKGLDYIKSFTHDGKTVIYVNLKDSVPKEEMQTRWHEIRNLVNDEWGSLPSGVMGPYINDRFDDVYGSIYAVTGDGFSYEEKRKYAENIRRRLTGVEDVQKVELLGVQKQEIYVEMDQNKLASFGMRPSDVFAMLQQQGAMMPAGMIHTDSRNVAVRVEGLLDTVESLKELPIHVGERSFHLGDVATVTQMYADPETSLMYFNGKPAVGIAVSMAPGGNNLVLGKNLEKEIEKEKAELPAGLDIEQVADQPSVVNDSIHEFTKSLLEAIVIVMAASFLSLGFWSGIVLALCIPVVVCASFIYMKWQGIDLHIVSLGTLIVSLGLLVDDAIIVIEMMQVKLEEGMDRLAAAQAAYKGCAKPMLAGTLITAAGFIPVGFAAGQTAEYVGAFFWVIASTLLLSWVASIFVSPVLGYRFIRVKAGEKKSAFADRAYRLFYKAIAWCIRFKKTVIIGTAAIFAGTVALIPFVNQEFFPDSVRPEIILDVNLPSGASIKETKEVMAGIADNLYGDNRVSSFSTYVGDSAPRFILLFDPLAPEDSHGQMILVARDSKVRDSLRDDTLAFIAEQYPDARAHARLITTGPPAEYPIMLRLSGKNVEDTAKFAKEAAALVSQYPGMKNVSMDWPEETPVVRLKIDQDKVRKLGGDNYSISRDLYVKLSGYKVAESYQGNQLVPISFRLEGSNAARLADLSSLPVHVGSGRYVPLGEIADISYENETSTIWRRDLHPTITIRGEAGGDKTADSVVNELYDRTLKDFREHLPDGYTLEKGGAIENSEKSVQYLAAPVPIMIFLILMILMFELDKIPLMVIAGITGPLGLIGAILSLFLTRQPMGFVSIVGMLALSGMVVRNSIILLDQIRQHLADGKKPYDAVIESAALRFRPIMLSSVTDVLGFVPLIPSPFWRPLAVSFIGGLLLATAIGLLVVPALYCWYYKVEGPKAS
ncbi:RND transporter, HAE1/HME family, permease protein [Dialister invisus DSM 15470]|jgi:multidrug efflux pump|uniref:RND transporter, HAE1/HME family, permease protein n=1 Tax=Dialister invisus DSM 15470 TaxID=592028 RepID=C9LN83_9FIRM|nr:efflux RND transporter permease subunit [Dialister invisus]EEW97019.1 RND transporter, HAE1/HME family, permease protein [Dialister invisus DSM 15470]